ncbi:MAG: hypothetical protein ABJF04_17365 [Reichenbachiella sp.]|uniref:hypothetical protein n=1 Tax=Reichenbachiella sp. TaxID=2184521 RepID=UPI0032656C6E
MKYDEFPIAILLLFAGIILFFSCTEETELKQPKDAVYTTITDTNFERALIALDIDTEKEEDGKILTSDISQVSALDISGRNISSLAGIEEFTDLETLNVAKNKLTQLELDQLTALTSLDVSGNALTSLDISQLTLLEVMIINNNPDLHCVYISENQSVAIVTKDDHQNLASDDCKTQEAFIRIDDENFEKQLIALGIDSDGTVNQQLLREDAIAVTKLSLTVATGSSAAIKIKDLTGIEAFVNLTELYVGNHLLDVLSLAANTQLTTLDAGINNLKQIELSTNKNLEVLSLLANELSTIDLSENKRLKEIDLSVNDLSSIEGLNEAVNLTTLNLSFNLLETVSVSLPLLETLSVENNTLKALDVRDTPLLKSLNARVNSITALDVTNHKALETLILSANEIETINLNNNVNLELLWISSNHLTGLDVSSLSKLYNITVDRNPDLDCIQIASGQAIASIGKEDRQEFREGGCSEGAEEYITIPDENFERMMVLFLDDSDGLINQKILRSDAEQIITLDLRQSSTANEAVKIKDLAGIEGFVNLEKLYVENNLLESLDLSKNTNLTTLHLQGNLLTNLDVSANTQLKDTNFSDNWLESINLGSNTNYTSLFLHNNKLQTVDVSAQSALKDLFLQDNALESVNLSANLAHLYLQDNQLTKLDVSTLAELTTLFVKRNAGLNCIKIFDGQNFTSLSTDSHQALNVNCD